MLLCAKSGIHRISLAHIDLTNMNHDEVLFQHIRTEYARLRGRAARNPFLVPRTMHYIKVRRGNLGLLSKLANFKCSCSWYSDTNPRNASGTSTWTLLTPSRPRNTSEKGYTPTSPAPWTCLRSRYIPMSSCILSSTREIIAALRSSSAYPRRCIASFRVGTIPSKPLWGGAFISSMALTGDSFGCWCFLPFSCLVS